MLTSKHHIDSQFNEIMSKLNSQTRKNTIKIGPDFNFILMLNLRIFEKSGQD